MKRYGFVSAAALICGLVIGGDGPVSAETIDYDSIVQTGQIGAASRRVDEHDTGKPRRNGEDADSPDSAIRIAVA
jgi:hypothetical protein